MKEELKDIGQINTAFHSLVGLHTGNVLNEDGLAMRQLPRMFAQAVKDIAKFQADLFINPDYAIRHGGERATQASQVIDRLAKFYSHLVALCAKAYTASSLPSAADLPFADFKCCFAQCAADCREEWSEEMLTNNRPLGHASTSELFFQRREVTANLLLELSRIINQLSK